MDLRLASKLWIDARRRLVERRGGYFTVIRGGHDIAGAIQIVFRRRDGHFDLAVPSPDGAGEEGDRVFNWAGRDLSPEALDAHIAREVRFDPDFWLIECEGAPDLPSVFGLE